MECILNIKTSKKIGFSLFSKKTHETHRDSPKTYPPDYSKELIELFKKNNIQTIQIGIKEEPSIGADIRYDKLSIPELLKLYKELDCIICCDNFTHHFCHFYGIKCIVIFSQSNPSIFGYKDNFNLLKDPKYLRPNRQQFEFWESAKTINEAFVEPQVVFNCFKENFLK